MTKNEAIQKLTNVALGEVGYLEKKTNSHLYSATANAGSNNYTKYGYEMHNILPSVMDFPAAWCDAFCDWCFVQAFGVDNARKLLTEFDDYTVTSAQYFKNKKQWHTTPQKGDQIFFKNSTGICHTGIVYDVSNSTVYTIEGNTSGGNTLVANGGGVAKKSYPLTYSKIAGYGRPDYASISTETSTPTIIEYENSEEILWELLHRQIVSNEQLWRDYMANDTNVYWLCRKIVQYVRTKTVTEYADSEYEDIPTILWELTFRGIVTDEPLWLEKISADTNIYWLCRKAVHYMRTQKKEI